MFVVFMTGRVERARERENFNFDFRRMEDMRIERRKPRREGRSWRERIWEEWRQRRRTEDGGRRQRRRRGGMRRVKNLDTVETVMSSMANYVVCNCSRLLESNQRWICTDQRAIDC